MAQTFYPITPTEIVASAANDWVTMDASGSAPANATGVILHVVDTSGASRRIGLRKNGSTDDRHPDMKNASHFWAMIGVDASRYFEAYVESTTDIDIYVVGYTMAGVTFATNADDKSLATDDTWVAIDCSTEAPSAIGLIWEVLGGEGLLRYAGFRKNGSTDNRHGDIHYHSCFGAVIGCDASQICEGYIEATTVDFFLVGYITDGVTFNTNADDVSLGSAGSYIDLSALSSGANMGIIEIYKTGAASLFGLRKNGQSGGYYDLYQDCYITPWAIVECDEDRLIEGKIESTGCDFFVVGYSTTAVAVQTLIPDAIASAEAFGTSQLNLWTHPSAIASLEAFGTLKANFTLAPSAIATAEAFGSPVMIAGIGPSAIASLEAFGTPVVAGPIICTGIAGAEAFGTAQLNLKIEPSAIASLEAFGTLTIVYTLEPSGIASAEVIGSHQLNLRLAPSGIASAEAFGTLKIILYLIAEAIASAEALGIPQLNFILTPSGIASLEAFGTCQVNLWLHPSGVISSEAFGTATIRLYLLPEAIASEEAFGVAIISVQGRLLAIKVTTSQYRQIKTATAQNRVIKIVTAQNKAIEVNTALKRAIRVETAQKRKIKVITSGG